MFCFQTPFTRASRVLVSSLSSSKTKTSSMNMILPANKSSKCDGQDSEVTSEGSGSSIGYIDQEPLVSDASSTDSTLPDIKADYLDPETLSPGPESLTAPASVGIVENGIEEQQDHNKLAGDNEQSHHVTPSSSPEKQTYRNRRCKKLLLRLRSNESSNSTDNKENYLVDAIDDSIETESPASLRECGEEVKEYETGDTPTLLMNSSPSVLIDSVDEDEDVLRNCRVTAASENDISLLQNVFSESEKENASNQETETETEEGSSLPLSPAGPSNGGLSSSTVPYYNFLCVNGGAMRQEMTSTSSPQLSSDSNHRSSAESTSTDGCNSFNVEKSSRIDTLKPEGLGSTFCLPAARSCPNLERQSAGCSPTSGSSGSSPSPGPVGPRFKPIEEGDIQVCFLNYTNLVKKILSSKYLRRWETHHLYLNDTCISSKTRTGFFRQPIPYSNMSDIRKYAVARWDPTYKNCLSIVLPNSSLLLQANNAYTRDQWYHSILWKRSIFKYQHLLSLNTREEVIIKELKSMVDFALWTSLQDERVSVAPLEAVAKHLEDSTVEGPSEKNSEKSIEEISRYQNDRKHWAESVLSVVSPLLDKVALPVCLAKVLVKLTQQHPQSSLVTALSPAITRCLKHTVDFGKSLDMRKLLQVYIAALYATDGDQAIRDYIASVHGPGSDCPHPRILPNLVSVCVAAIFHRFEVANRSLPENDKSATLPALDCYLLVLSIASEYADWRPELGALLQPVPFPEEAFGMKEVQQSILMCVISRLAKDKRCVVHRVLLPIREPRPGWIHIAAPSSPDCPDQGELFGEMLTTLLACCCRRKKFISWLMKQVRDDCILLAVRGCEAAQEALCLMLEWHLLPSKDAKLQIVSALESTPTGKERYSALCQRQRNLQQLLRKGGPRRLTLPARATDADVARLLSGRALGSLEYLSLAFTSVTSACAEQLIKLPALRYLNLWATQFGDAGLQMISEHLQKLQVLNLCETPVSDKGISTLASLTSLRKLNLNSTKLSVQTFESLKKCLPALQEFDVRYTDAW
ncbi:C-Maf-inducing protein [Xylocopa sonorina]|uniref:C-Maf-inducing protein n=1 Tax=Xylocopa sonorina TaxID=1818115 RepID=UPI00403ADED3